MDWVLIIYLWSSMGAGPKFMPGGYSSVITTVPVGSKELCEQAVRDIMATVKNIGLLKCVKVR